MLLWHQLYSKDETMTENERERGRDKEWDTSRIKEWFYIIKQIEVITAAYPQSTNCAHSASLWSERLQTVADGLITVPQWNKCFRVITAIHKPFPEHTSSHQKRCFLSSFVFVFSVFLSHLSHLQAFFLCPLMIEHCVFIYLCILLWPMIQKGGEGETHVFI